MLLLEQCPNLCEKILRDSYKYLPLYDLALFRAEQELYKSMDEDSRELLTVKEHVHFRVYGLPGRQLIWIYIVIYMS